MDAARRPAGDAGQVKKTPMPTKQFLLPHFHLYNFCWQVLFPGLKHDGTVPSVVIFLSFLRG